MKRQILSWIANGMNTGKLIRCSKSPVILPFYHTVSDDYLPHIHPLYKPKNIDQFRNDLEFLLKYFQPVSMDDLFAHSQRRKIISKPSFHLSFDDGLREIYDIVFPILSEKGIPFTVFVNSNFVDNRDLFFRYKAALIIDQLKNDTFPLSKEEILSITYQEKERLESIAEKLGIRFSDFLKDQRPYLTKEELKTMQSQGVTIGAHSVDHPLYGRLPEDEQIKQTLESSRYVKANFEESIACFAFPFTDTDVSPSVFSQIYSFVDLTFGISGIYSRQEGRHWGRIDMEKYGKDARECVNKACLVSFLKKNC